jgi:ribonuclease-3
VSRVRFEPADLQPREEAGEGKGEGWRELEHRLGYSFGEPLLLRTALTHRSVGAARGVHNEILEFLGDAVLGLVISDLLIRAWPEVDEGVLSKRRSALVNEQALAAKARVLELGALMALGRGEEKTQGREKPSILAGAFEALVGAIFREGGFVAAQAVIARMFAEDIDVPPVTESGEFKTRLQELAQRLFRTSPEYTLLGASGPDHAKHFTSRVAIAGRVYGEGSGPSKKLAEQAAACSALVVLEGGDLARCGNDAERSE